MTFRSDRERGEPLRSGDVSAGKATAGELADAAKDAAVARAQGLFESNKQAVCSQIGAVAQAVRNASFEFEGQQQPLARAARRAADGMESFTRALGERDLAGALESAQAYARRRPGLFFGAAFLLGVAAARFLKASGERERLRQAPYGAWPRGNGGGPDRPMPAPLT